MNLSNSDLYIKVGNLGFERTWMKKLETNAPHMIIIDASADIHLQKSVNGIEDPHTWTSAANALRMARNIYKALAEVDSKDSTYFKANLDNLVDKIERVDRAIRLKLTKDKTRGFLIYHPSLTYFAREYGLTQIPIEEEGREPSATQLRSVIANARDKGVKTLFVQKGFANRNVNIVAKSCGATMTDINPLNYHWDQEMVRIAEKLK